MTTQAAPAPVSLLVIDDDPRFPDYLRVMLRASNTSFKIDVACTVRDGLHALARAKHQVCLLDYRLGQEDGLNVLRRAKARGLRTPIVLLTGEGSTSLDVTAIEEGATDYLDKSELDPHRLERTLCRAIARHRADMTLHLREERLAEAEASAHVMPAHMALDGHWLKVPRRLCELLGYTEDELLALGLSDVTHPEDMEHHVERRQRVRDGSARSIELEKRYLRKDGGIVWMYQNCSLVTGEDAAPLYFLVYLRDISDQKRAETALAASEQRYRSMVRNAPYGIFKTTQDGRFLAGNPALVTMLRSGSEEQLLPLSPDALYGGADARTSVLQQLTTSAPLGSVDTRWWRADGTPILVRLSAHLTPGADGGVIDGVVEDITERKRLEEQLRQSQKMEAIGQLAGGVAHDLNNLLTTILGYTDLLIDRCDDVPDLCADLEEIQNAGTSAATLTEQLLAFSRKQVLKPQVLSVNAVIEGMQEMLPGMLGEDIELVTALRADGSSIEADPVQLQQVMLNLVLNARDAMPRGGRLVIETADVVSNGSDSGEGSTLLKGRYVVIIVRDNGCGMDAATQARMFEPFFTTKGAGKGTGLGLATVYGIIKQTGGDIVCESQPGAGCTFSIFLPVSTKGSRLEAPAARVTASGVETVLLVEDQDAVRRLTRRLLESHGFRVFDTADTEIALQIAAKSPFDLLLTDVVMPQMSGPELARQIRAFAPDVPVLYMSGFAGHSALEELSGAQLLSKPFTPAALVTMVRELLKRPRGVEPPVFTS